MIQTELGHESRGGGREAGKESGAKMPGVNQESKQARRVRIKTHCRQNG